jgi:hypothetical protein
LAGGAGDSDSNGNRIHKIKIAGEYSCRAAKCKIKRVTAMAA